MSSIEDEVSWVVEYYWSKLSDQSAAQQEGEDAARGRRERCRDSCSIRVPSQASA